MAKNMLQHSESVIEINTSQIEVKGADHVSLAVSEQGRREALRKIGRYSAYAAPAMVAMLTGRAIAAS